MIAETYEVTSEGLRRTIRIGELAFETLLRTDSPSDLENAPLPHLWWQHILRGQRPSGSPHGVIRIADLFSSVGGLSVGAGLAIGAAGHEARYALAVDLDEDALNVYSNNLGPKLTLRSDVSRLTDFTYFGRGESASLAYSPTIEVDAIQKLVGNIDLVLAGPPCQGHSNLNNHTRREDPRNGLYVDAVATGIALQSPMIVVENVPEVVRDKTQVVETSKAILKQSGYHVSTGVISASRVGGAQTRRRHFLIATKMAHFPVEKSHLRFAQDPMTLREAIGDLEHHRSADFMDAPSVLSPENERRIEYLFENDLHELPNHIRPDSHKNGHTYPSVYGRMHWDKPAQTITTGFMSPGRGRYIHPSCPRVLTPREAARLQGFPDTFSFALNGAEPTRKQLSKWIGDAVPTILGYVAVLTALSGYLEQGTQPEVGEQERQAIGVI